MSYKMTETRFKVDAKSAVKASLKPSNIAIGVAIASQAKVLAPVKEGQLRNSISASSLSKTYLLNNRKGNTALGLETTGLKGDEVYVGSNSDHTIFQEYGTINQPAQPFLRPSAELIVGKKESSEIIKEFCREKMLEELKKRKEVKAAQLAGVM